MQEISVTRTTAPKAKPEEATLGFGQHFTDHMFLMDYNHKAGWHNPRIVPFGPIPMHPAATALHYGAEIFEGLKAYRRPDGRVQLFRPRDNFERMNNSARRMCLPLLDEEYALYALKELLKLEESWVPSSPGASLYIRPFLIGCDPFLGVHTTNRALYMVILSPSGSYYKEGINPVKIMVENRDVRAVRGGTGEAKCGGNYAASMRAGKRAEDAGYTQVLWLDGVERKYVEEVGAMNVMFMMGDVMVTPALTGSVLPGVTRKSCIALLRRWGVPVEERLLAAEEIKQAIADGTLKEAFGTGTAAVVSPIGELNIDGAAHVVNNGEIGPVTRRLYDELTGIQWGITGDAFGWTMLIDE